MSLSGKLLFKPEVCSMATIIPETAPTSNYHVPDYLSRPAKKGTLRALGTSLSMQIGKISFKVSLSEYPLRIDAR